MPSPDAPSQWEHALRIHNSDMEFTLRMDTDEEMHQWRNTLLTLRQREETRNRKSDPTLQSKASGGTAASPSNRPLMRAQPPPASGACQWWLCASSWVSCH